MGDIRLFRCLLDLPGSSDSKESACNAGDLGSIPGLRRSFGGGHGNPLQYSCLENPHGQRSLVGYCPWVAKSPTRLSTTPHMAPHRKQSEKERTSKVVRDGSMVLQFLEL